MEISAKAARKMLVKLSTGGCPVSCESIFEFSRTQEGEQESLDRVEKFEYKKI